MATYADLQEENEELRYVNARLRHALREAEQDLVDAKRRNLRLWEEIDKLGSKMLNVKFRTVRRKRRKKK